MDLSEEDIQLLLDLGLIDEPNLEELAAASGPPEEPPVPTIDSPPGEYTEYSDTPASYRLFRVSRAQTQEEAEAAVKKECERGWRIHGEGFWSANWWCWRLVK